MKLLNPTDKYKESYFDLIRCAKENGGIFESKGLKGECISSVGCGDSMVAGFVAAYLKCSNYEEAFKLAMACGSATAFSEDLAKIEMIERCYNELEVRK